MEKRQWHAQSIEETLKSLNATPEGLSTEESTRRLVEYGPNELVERKRITPLQIFLNQFKDIFVIMLLAAIVLSVIIGWYKSAGGSLEEYVDAITIGLIVALNSVVGFFQEYRSEKAIEAMKRLSAPRAHVLRDGKIITIPAREAVPGDILVLEAGDNVPADAVLIDAVDLKAEEAALTGESASVSKRIGPVEERAAVADRKNMVFMGTHVTYGRGKAVVTGTGMKTEFGKIAEMMQGVEEEQTPLQQKLENFAKKLGKIIIGICLLIFVIEILRNGLHLETAIDALMISVSLAVSAVPEGLPAVVTVALALGARELAKRNAIIRKLSSAETLGAVTVICSDKTGTLTKGEMTVREIYVDKHVVEVTGVGYEPKGEFLVDGKPVKSEEEQGLRLILKASALCNNAQCDGKSVIGDTTEGALIVAAAKRGLVKEDLEKESPRVHEVAFTSERKRMTTVHRADGEKLFTCVKGAPEMILERCNSIIVKGKITKLDQKMRKKILEANEGMANKALRVLGVAYKEIAASEAGDFDEEMLESNLVFIGLTGMIDPPRAEAMGAVKKCDEAGIRTVMITGDHQMTAVAVAKELGILKEGMVLTGAELDALSAEEFQKIVNKVNVYARVSPEHKIKIVRALRKMGNVVAMSGDGVNDAPALKQSDIGVAMGITGTDVTREASDLVLADDNFATIVNAVEGGRTIYDNIRKFAFFLMRCNFDELAIIGTFALLGLELPLTPAMILWLNLATDGGPALALTMDPPEKDVMKRPPRNPNEGVLSGRLASIITTFILQFALTGGLFYWQYYMLPGALTAEKLAKARTMAFMRATLQELFIVWNCRSERHNAFKTGFLSNRFLLLAVSVSLALAIILPYLGIFGMVWITNPTDWAIVIGTSMTGLLIMPEIFYGRKIWRWR